MPEIKAEDRETPERAEQAITSLRVLADECAQLRVALEDTQIQADKWADQAAMSRRELDDANRRIEELTRQLGEAQTRAMSAQLRQTVLKKADAEREALREDYAVASQDLQAANKELALANQNLEAYRNILEQKVEERTAALRASESRTRAIVEATGDAIVIVREDGTVDSVNAAAEAMFGYTREEIVGQNVGILMTPFDRARLRQYMSRDPRTGTILAVTKARLGMAQRYDGSVFPIGITVTEGQDGNTGFLVGSLRDLSPRTEGESAPYLQSLQAEAQRLSVMGGMSEALAHELTQPLTAIRCYIRACRSAMENDDDGVRTRALDELAKTDEEVKRIGHLIRSFRDLFETGGTERREENANGLVQTALALALTGQRHASARITTDLAENLPKVSVNRIQIEQVVVNLVRNALEAIAGRKRGEVIVSTARESETMVRITVSDNGPGIDKEIMPRLFFPFVSTKAQGTGIGLPVCKRIVEAHDGTITAKSRSKGGAVFSFTLRAVRGERRPRGKDKG